MVHGDEDDVFEDIRLGVQEVQSTTGFGELRIQIKNGHIYHIDTTVSKHFGNELASKGDKQSRK